MGENYALELRDISKSFGSVQANDHVDLTLRKSEILAILGENGSGKTTLMNMIYGIYYPDEGHIFVNGKEVTIRSPKDSYELGIGMVHQHFKLVDVLTAAENIVLGLPGKGKLDMKRITEDIQKLADKYGFELDLSQKIYEMSVSQKQTVEIIKMLYRGARILILDEPTSFLDVKHKLELLAILEKMAREKKMTVIMSLHEIDLAQKVSDKIVCVQGENISHFGKPEEVFQEEIIRDLYGITNGSFDPRFGSIELPGIKGEPEVLVISSGGSGIPVYRKLRKERIPFAAGILYENDIDCELARQLAVEVITEKAFEEISDETFASAEKMIERCGRVIDAGVQIGTYNRRIGELLEQAERLGKLERAGTLK